ncbi:hypothetical protein MPSYJ_07090 [Mycolicibacterium psychrotolerans]|uniref:Uncharacterized protein n=1 Tax=Mycolicibacterium psychrotolerans TaxID=216929 RepID=A0A7I7M4X7_9MYCO|nr:hypothetical protein MPSYJ_07090 [Mycolicibacterium psychrotolerans]
MVFGVDVQALTVGGHHVEAEHALTRRPEDPAVPAVAALQQVAADPYALAVPGREEQPALVQQPGQHATAHSGADDGGPGAGVDVAVVEAADVEQHAAVAHMVTGPAVTARPDTDPHVVPCGVPHGGDHLIGIGGLHDDVGIALGRAGVPHRLGAGLLVAVVAAEEVPSVGKVRHCSALRG